MARNTNIKLRPTLHNYVDRCSPIYCRAFQFQSIPIQKALTLKYLQGAKAKSIADRKMAQARDQMLKINPECRKTKWYTYAEWLKELKKIRSTKRGRERHKKQKKKIDSKGRSLIISRDKLIRGGGAQILPPIIADGYVLDVSSASVMAQMFGALAIWGKWVTAVSMHVFPKGWKPFLHGENEREFIRQQMAKGQVEMGEDWGFVKKVLDASYMPCYA